MKETTKEVIIDMVLLALTNLFTLVLCIFLWAGFAPIAGMLMGGIVLMWDINMVVMTMRHMKRMNKIPEEA